MSWSKHHITIEGTLSLWWLNHCINRPRPEFHLDNTKGNFHVLDAIERVYLMFGVQPNSIISYYEILLLPMCDLELLIKPRVAKSYFSLLSLFELIDRSKFIAVKSSSTDTHNRHIFIIAYNEKAYWDKHKRKSSEILNPHQSLWGGNMASCKLELLTDPC